MKALGNIFTGIGEHARYGPNRISVINTVALHAIYGTKRTPRNRALTVSSVIFSAPKYRDQYRQKASRCEKKYTLKSFLRERTQGFGSFFSLTNVEKLSFHLTGLKSDNESDLLAVWSQPRDLAKSTSYMAFNAMAEIYFGQTFNTIKDQRNRFLMIVISNGAQALSITSVIAKYPEMSDIDSTCLLGGTYAVAVGSPTRSSLLSLSTSRA